VLSSSRCMIVKSFVVLFLVETFVLKREVSLELRS
jgi:hypothetical protein